MMVNSIKDIQNNAEYYLFIGNDFQGKPIKPRRVRILGIVQKSKKSEFFVCNLLTNGKQSYWVTNIWGIEECGLGLSEKEAIENYRKIIDYKLAKSHDSIDSLETDLEKFEYAPKKYTYYNIKNRNYLECAERFLVISCLISTIHYNESIVIELVALCWIESTELLNQ